MTDEVMGIGAFAAGVGLSVSSLRFYDQAGVLTPAEVDPRTGYRRYGREQLVSGRLVSRLRRIGVGVPELKTLMSADADPQLVSEVLDRHLQRLEAGLADARHELSSLRAAIAVRAASEGDSASAVVSVLEVVGADLARAVEAVTFALPTAGDDPELELVLFELAGASLSLFASDRYRLASSSIPALLRAGDDLASFAVNPDIAARISSDARQGGTVRLEVSRTSLSVRVDDGMAVTFPLVQGALPALRPLVEAPRLTAQLLAGDSADLLTSLRTLAQPEEHDGGAGPIAVLAEDPHRPGRLSLVDPGNDGLGVRVNAAYLMEAIKAGPDGSVSVALQGQNPLAIRFGADPSTTSILMPRGD